VNIGWENDVGVKCWYNPNYIEIVDRILLIIYFYVLNIILTIYSILNIYSYMQVNKKTFFYIFNSRDPQSYTIYNLSTIRTCPLRDSLFAHGCLVLDFDKEGFGT